MELNKTKKDIIIMLILLLIAAVSFFWIAGIASSETSFPGTYQSLNEKSETVTELMGVTAASSTAISIAGIVLPSPIGLTELGGV